MTSLGIGSLKTSDGPAEARGVLSLDGPTAAFLPSPVSPAASWSKERLQSIARLLCKEAGKKSAQVLLVPTICCARNLLGGRKFEPYSEEPFLNGSLANKQEYQRFNINSNIDEKTLRGIYLKPFEMAIKLPNRPKCVISAYNLVNGSDVDMNDLLEKTLRDEWGFNGLVMSDWGGTNSAVESVLAGCDLELPGPPEKRGKLRF